MRAWVRERNPCSDDNVGVTMIKKKTPFVSTTRNYQCVCYMHYITVVRVDLGKNN